MVLYEKSEVNPQTNADPEGLLGSAPGERQLSFLPFTPWDPALHITKYIGYWNHTLELLLSKAFHRRIVKTATLTCA